MAKQVFIHTRMSLAYLTLAGISFYIRQNGQTNERSDEQLYTISKLYSVKSTCSEFKR